MSILEWIKQEPVLAAKTADVVLVVLGILMHKYGVEIPMELKLALDGLIVAALTGTSVKARQAVTPNSKL